MSEKTQDSERLGAPNYWGVPECTSIGSTVYITIPTSLAQSLRLLITSGMVRMHRKTGLAETDIGP